MTVVGWCASCPTRQPWSWLVPLAFPQARPPRAQDVALVERMFNAVGRAMVVSDEMMDVVTGLSGSGPAFIFALIEGLSDGGVLMGLRARQPPS